MLFGYNKDDTFEMPVRTLVPDDLRGDYSKMIDQVIQYGYTEPHESTRRMFDGEDIDVFVEVTLLRDEDGKAEAVATVERDITPQREAEAQIHQMGEHAKEMRSAAELMLQDLNDKEIELVRKECLINGILGTAADGIITMSPDGTIETCNDAANRMFGYAADETAGMSIGTLLPGGAEIDGPLGALTNVVTNYSRLSKRMREAVSDNGHRKAGEEFPLTFSVSELHIGDKHLFTVIMRDETQRRMVENQLNDALERATAAVKAKSQFLATMSHEIRTPMNAVISIGELLEETELDDEQLDFVKTIRGSSQSLLMIINDILDFSKIESGNLELESVTMSLRELVESVGQMLAPQAYAKGVELILDTDPSCNVQIKSDPTRLRQVLINLTGNAIKFTDQGEVTIRANVEGHSENRGRVILEVIDTGIGIPSEAHAKIFESFSQADSSTTRQFGGTGLGLAISRQLSLLLGGEMGLDSVVGEGSRFWVEFPAAVDEPLTTTEVEHIEGRCVLLVEKNEVQRAKTQLRFETLGAEVYSSPDPAGALVHLSENPNSDWTVAVIECKSDDQESVDFVRNLATHAKWGNCPILILTEPGAEGLGLGITENPAMASVVKPLRFMPVAGALRSILTERKGSAVVEEPPAPLPTTAPELASETLAKGTDSSSAASSRFNDKGVEQFGFHVLLVEDNPINRKVAGKLLQRMGCTWDEAVNGELGVEAAFSGTKYDLILMDLMMPVMGGLDATKEIREREGSDRTRKIIAMTANAMEGDREMCLEAGMDEYVSKPVKPKILEEVFRKWGVPQDGAIQE